VAVEGKHTSAVEAVFVLVACKASSDAELVLTFAVLHQTNTAIAHLPHLLRLSSPSAVHTFIFAAIYRHK
jgi:hypothetical protein